MAKSTKTKAREYVAQVLLSSDKSGKYFEPGDTVTDKDFPAKVIENWLLLEVLVEKEVDDDSGEE